MLYFCIPAANDHLAQYFTDDCIKICTKALQCLSDLAEKLRVKSITVQELEVLNSHVIQVAKLFPPKVAEKATGDPAFCIKSTIAERNSEVERFESYCSAVRILLDHCEHISKGNCLRSYVLMFRCSYLDNLCSMFCTGYIQ